MSTDVEQIKGNMLFVQPLISERIASQLLGWNIEPIDSNGSIFDWCGQKRSYVPSCLTDLGGQLLLALRKFSVGLISLQIREVIARMATYSRYQFNGIGELHQIVA